VSALLALSSFIIASSVFRSWSATMRPHPSFYVGLAASAAGGFILLALLYGSAPSWGATWPRTWMVHDRTDDDGRTDRQPATGGRG
jgi:hypothetical protein